VNRPVTRTMILEHVWNSSFEGLTNVVDVCISSLRSKIDRDFPQKLIQTTRGIGYTLTCMTACPCPDTGRLGKNGATAVLSKRLPKGNPLRLLMHAAALRQLSCASWPEAPRTERKQITESIKYGYSSGFSGTPNAPSPGANGSMCNNHSFASPTGGGTERYAHGRNWCKAPCDSPAMATLFARG
jgi:hypothetical protein